MRFFCTRETTILHNMESLVFMYVIVRQFRRLVETSIEGQILVRLLFGIEARGKMLK